ncbi:N-acetylmuramoyl-L-alanine amidase [Salipiger aestuarii]|uniref:N-acetylmuramoyl-L-alanine amidase n=1 Tax=Salipiger aestuarii TaxID=568098 RepID=A0A327YE29_9RHOB|nr:N-acetylmuramoyl-L-alanine amidase [Salipiger aestuarii]EIE51957.1 N-acetylmuramoyl-L-alanine amidase [Citreicella sp. 357]KAA8609505.1 N-acetylmuramoyl-L-alanine amidase [Salipiger aestuarii]KAA8610990.1 N-acetylmuramoyl-L-alanine amidase [Salipiger aestuarii]KAB2542436.1 N-acetylmuramoyl-L-alanine amidase [Salipiger aestuarii]RAK18767.1 N-acetylmuramoyl-L-alanine amidase [Salipiger aestuarii]
MSRILAGFFGLFLAHAAVAQDLGGRAMFVAGGIADARNGAELTLDLSQGVPWRAFTLTDPPRLVLDFREVDWTGADSKAMVHSDAVKTLRMGPFSAGWSRLVAVLNAPMLIDRAGMRVDDASGRAALAITLRGATVEDMRASSGAPRDPRWDLPQVTLKAPSRGADAPLRIVLDPGHGGIDPGAERGGVQEAELMLTFARELRDVLRRAGFAVMLTRDDDVFISLEGRVAAAHDARADLFVSLHADAIEEGIAHGASVYMLDENASDAASAALAERHDRDDILAGLDLSGSDDRIADVLLDIARLDNSPRSLSLARHLLGGIENAVGEVHKRPLRRAGFSVLKAADIPSVLIELGFLSTARDRTNLQDPYWRAGMAAGIRDGIAAWAIEDAALARLRRQ